MSKQRKSFLIYIDTLPLFDELNDADELSLCRAINHYHRDLPIELTEVARPLFRIFQAQFERDNERYAARCEKNGRERLRFGKKELMMMRQHQVEVGKAFGLNMRASYCNEREIDIIGTKAKPKRKTLLERQVPEWSKRRKTEAGQRLPFGITIEAKRYDINETAQRTLDEWARHFTEPERAT